MDDAPWPSGFGPPGQQQREPAAAVPSRPAAVKAVELEVAVQEAMWPSGFAAVGELLCRADSMLLRKHCNHG